MRATVGNALVSLEADVTARIGWNLSGFSVAPIPAPPPPAPMLSDNRSNRLEGDIGLLKSFNIFVSGGLKAVAHNIFLDGNSFARNDIRISRTPLVPEFAAGFEANIIGNIWLTYQFIHRGSEFTTWRGRKAGNQEFGSLTVAFMKRL